ncbi:MAG: hypothetical protein QXL94_03500, partial [Candidatus Parvarchaeum sp.]
VNMQSDMQYNIVAYDELYYLAGTRFAEQIGSADNPVDAAVLLEKLAAYSTVNYSFSNIGYGGFYTTVTASEQFYYNFLQLATILGYATYMDNNNTLHLQPYISKSSSIVITEYEGNFFSSTYNDTNYFYDAASIILSAGGSTVSTTTVSSNNATTSATSKRIDMSWLNIVSNQPWANGSTSSPTELTKMALQMFPNGYREVDAWYSLTAPYATTMLNIGFNANITLNLADGRVWENMFLTKTVVSTTGLTLTFSNFPKEVWSQLQTVTSYAP